MKNPIKLKKLFRVNTGWTPTKIAILSLVGLALMYFSPFLAVAGGAAFATLGTVVAKSAELIAIEEVEKRIKTDAEEFRKSLEGKVSKDQLDSAMTALAAIQAVLDDFKTQIAAMENESATEAQVQESEKRLKDEMVKVNTKMEEAYTKLKEMQEDIAIVKENGKRGKKGEFLSTKQVEEFIKATFNGSEIGKGTKTHNAAAIKMDFNIVRARVGKAAEDMVNPDFYQGVAGEGDSTVFTGRFIDPELYQRKRKKNLILDYFDIQTINAPALFYMEKIEVAGANESSEDVGGADWIVSGAAKPKRSFRVTTGKAEAKKVAIFGTVEDKLLRDVPSLENWVREDFTLEIKEKYNDALLNNNPGVDPDAPLGLKQNAIQFDPTPAFLNQITNPNYIDEVMAAAASMSEVFEEAGRAFVAWDVYYRIMSLKDDQGRYLNNDKVYVDAMGRLFIGGVEIVPVNSQDVPSTHLLLIGIDLGFKIKNYGPLVFERGLNGNDFQEDKTSYRGYQEVLAYIATHRENSVLYDTWQNIQAGIEATS